ncbi:aminotransferase class III-fold pyridoxal phosphate-dependent enzyme, partial [PVC group bacterium]|nr:aminotransferase class III-fold pyridoxal phosphate-dependent enzyme [PVC group bacterium]
MDLFQKIYHPLLFRSKKIPYPHCYRCPYKKHPQTCHKECVSDMKRKIRQYANETAALIMEPLQGASGMRKSPRGYFKEVERACQKHRVLLIVDEVATGFGRTGKMFACEHERVQPDLLTLAKGLTGGYLPLAATLTTQEIYQAFKAPYHLSKTFFHGHTYTGNPLASGLALENIRLFQKNGVLKKLKEKIQHLRISLCLLETHPHVGDIRQCGFMVGIELVENKKTKKMFPLSQKVGARVCRRARYYGVILRPLGDVIVLMPPLSATKRQLTYLCRTVLKCLYDELGARPKNT